MLQPIDDALRGQILRLAAACCIGSCLLVPLAARSALEIANQQAALAPLLIVPRLNDARTVVPEARDPFVADAPAGAGDNTTSPGLAGLAGDLSLPPNSGAPLATLPFTSPVVRGIVLGEDPQALITDGAAATRVVGVGDMLDGARIAAIDRSGVRVQSGRVYPLETTPVSR